MTVVTLNLRHFRPEHLEPWGIHAMHPQAFPIAIFRQEQALVVTRLERQATDRRCPVRQLLDNLSTTVSEFVVALVSGALPSRQSRFTLVPCHSSQSRPLRDCKTGPLFTLAALPLNQVPLRPRHPTRASPALHHSPVQGLILRDDQIGREPLHRRSARRQTHFPAPV